MPEALSLLTFDDYDWMTLVNPPLTAIAQPAVAMGARAVELLLRSIQGEPGVERELVVLQTRFVERASCAPPGERSVPAGVQFREAESAVRATTVA